MPTKITPGIILKEKHFFRTITKGIGCDFSIFFFFEMKAGCHLSAIQQM